LGIVKKLKKARHKLRSKARGLTEVELAELEVLKKKTEKEERMKHKRWETKEKIKRKYARKRKQVEAGKGGHGTLDTAKKAWGWLQTRGEHARIRIEAEQRGRGRELSFDDIADKLVFGRKKRRKK